MSNPSTVGVDGNSPAVIVTSTTVSSVTLDPNKEYFIRHNGIDPGGNDTGDAIYLATDDGTTELDGSEGTDRAILPDLLDMTIGPGVTTLRFDAAANDPTFTIVPGQDTKGRW